jgi:hypothetical protein
MRSLIPLNLAPFLTGRIENMSQLTNLESMLGTLEYLLQNLISFTTDDASNMTGGQNGVAALLVDILPDVLGFVWYSRL